MSGREAPRALPGSAGIATGEPGPRPRVRPRALAGGTFRLGRRLGRRRGLLVVDEDLLHRFTVEQGDELLRVDRLVLEQDLRDRVELCALVVEDVLGGLVGGLDDATDLVVDLTGDLVGVVGLGGELATEEGLAAMVAEDART